MADDLYDIRNAIILGNFPQVISDGSSIKSNPYRKQEENDAMLAERDAIVFRAHIGMGQYDIVIDDLANATTPQLKAIRFLAQFMKADAQDNESQKANVVSSAKDLLKTAEESLTPAMYLHVVIVVASILIQNMEYEPALKLLRGVQTTAASTQSPALLEVHGLVVDILLRIHRPDQAEKEHKQMATVDDDATISQLCAAWICLAKGGDAVEEAIQIFDELKEKFGSTVLLLNGLAIAQMAKGNFDTAEKLLLDAMSKRGSDPETLINLITCSQHLKKGMDLINRYITQLKSSSPNHPWVRSYLAMESKFDKTAKSQA
jgi:predicted Zn-dependent protease